MASAKNRDIIRMLNELIELDYDTIEAYRVAIDRLAQPGDRDQLQDYLDDHERHVRELGELVRSLGGEPSDGPDFKRIVTRGKVMLAGLLDDRAVMFAMKTNENDVHRAYSRAVAHKDLPDPVRRVLEHDQQDERRHRSWITARLEQLAESYANRP